MDLNWVTSIPLVGKLRVPTNTTALASVCYGTVLRDQFSEVLTEELISKASLIGHSSLLPWKENSTLFRKTG